MDSYVLDDQRISPSPQMNHELGCDTVTMQHSDWTGNVYVIAEMAIQHFCCKIHEIVDLSANDDQFHLENIRH